MKKQSFMIVEIPHTWVILVTVFVSPETQIWFYMQLQGLKY